MVTTPTQAAYKIDDELVSREQFYALACHPQRSVVVEACAGAGKTWMLVSRMVRALLEGAQAHEILAITFTRKAAAEMRQRLLDWLRDWGACHSTPEQRIAELCARGMTLTQAHAAQEALAQLNANLLRSGRTVEIRTFHAWFSQLLRGAPLELLAQLQLSPNLRLLEEVTDHHPAIFRRFHQRVLADGQLLEDYHAQVHLRGRTSVQKWLVLALDKRVEIELAHHAGVLDHSVAAVCEAPLEPCAALRSAAHQSVLHSLVAKLLRAAPGTLQSKAAQQLQQAALLENDREAFEAVFKALITDKLTPRTRLGDHPEQREACELLLHIRQAQHQHEAHVEHLRMTRLSLALMEEFSAYKRDQGLADMVDLERCALALLRDSSLSAWMQERLDARVRHVLIDEFQDTSPLQWHALHAWLSGYAGAGGGHSGQRPPAVFIVGDPKQSIYRFRRAEPRVFEAARDFVVQGLGGAVLSCDHTRRNAPEVLFALNSVFEQAQNQGAWSGFRPHTTEVHTSRAQHPAGVLPSGAFALPPIQRTSPEKPAACDAAPWRDTLRTSRDEPTTILRQQEARLVAQAIAHLLSGQVHHPRLLRPLQPGDIQVLSRKRASLRLLAQELQALHIPFAAPAALVLTDAAEVQDVVALLDALASEQHHLSLLRALRSPIFGVSDEDLIMLAHQRELAATPPHPLHPPELRADPATQPTWWLTLMQRPRDTLSPAMQRAQNLLASWREVAHQLPPHAVLDRIFDQGQVIERMVAAVPESARSSVQFALQALVTQSLVLDGARYATLYNFVRALKQRAPKLMPAAHATAVQLLTVHGAKGLEAEVVFIMDADPEPTKAEHTTVLVDWPVQSPAPVVCAFVYSESCCPPSLQALLERENLARNREEINGLYVAMTRARECLVISSTERRNTHTQRGTQASEPSSVRSGTDAQPCMPWWQRLQPSLSPWPLWAAQDGSMDQTHAQPKAHDQTEAAPIAYLTLPTLQTELPTKALVNSMEVQELTQPNSPSSLIGQAVHLALQWLTQSKSLAPRAAMEAAALQFQVPHEPVAKVVMRILESPSCAPFFDPSHVCWAANEVCITVQGRVQRIDRLVSRPLEQGGVCWWVLDYKLHESPHTLSAYREQLLAYRAAVAQLQPGDPVHCAFITSQGELCELQTGG